MLFIHVPMSGALLSLLCLCLSMMLMLSACVCVSSQFFLSTCNQIYPRVQIKLPYLTLPYLTLSSKIIATNHIQRGKDKKPKGSECIQLLVLCKTTQPQSRAPQLSCLGPPGVLGRPCVSVKDTSNLLQLLNNPLYLHKYTHKTSVTITLVLLG